MKYKEFNKEILNYLKNKYKCGYGSYWFLQDVIDKIERKEELTDIEYRILKYHYNMEITSRKIGIYI